MKNQAISPTIPITIAHTLRFKKPHAATKASTIAIITNSTTPKPLCPFLSSSIFFIFSFSPNIILFFYDLSTSLNFPQNIYTKKTMNYIVFEYGGKYPERAIAIVLQTRAIALSTRFCFCKFHLSYVYNNLSLKERKHKLNMGAICANTTSHSTDYLSWNLSKNRISAPIPPPQCTTVEMVFPFYPSFFSSPTKGFYFLFLDIVLVIENKIKRLLWAKLDLTSVFLFSADFCRLHPPYLSGGRILSMTAHVFI